MPFLPVKLETASEAPCSGQTGPCRAFLRSGVHPPPLLLSPFAPLSLISASHTAMVCFLYDLEFHVKKQRARKNLCLEASL